MFIIKVATDVQNKVKKEKLLNKKVKHESPVACIDISSGSCVSDDKEANIALGYYLYTTRC